MELLQSWLEEQRSAYLYFIIAQVETSHKYKTLFADLAKAALEQAAIWEEELQKNNQPAPPAYHPDIRTRIVGWLIQRFGAKRMRFILSSLKVRGMSVYLDAEPSPDAALSPPLTHETHHKTVTSGGNLRAAVFGINDGLLSNASLIYGIAGANANLHFIILSGVAGLLAGACSMAAGEFVSVSSQRELFEYQIALEKSEIELYPKEEAAELALIYEARGLPRTEARKIAHLLISNPEKALDTLAREELGVNPAEISSPWGAAISSFCSFCIGAIIPLLPFLFGQHHWSLPVSLLLTALTLFSIGSLLSLFTNRNALLSGLRMLLIGVLASGLTYLVGKILGVALM